jgi:hypothetical protein
MSEDILVEHTPDVVYVEGANGGELISVGVAGPPGTVNPQEFVVPYSATPVINWDTGGDMAVLTITGNPVISLVGARKKVLLALIQGAGGGHTVTFDGTVGVGAPGLPQLSNVQGRTDYLGFIKNAATGKYDLLGFSTGFF